MSTRRFFSGRTLEQALLEAARHHGLEPEEVVYRLRETHGVSKARGKTVIEVDPDSPDAADELEDSVREAVERVLDLAGLDLVASPLAGADGETIEIDVDGADREIVWAEDGEVLRALELLASLVLRQEHGRVEWNLDCAGRRRARRDEIRGEARAVVREVRRTGEEVALEPQDPAERRIVHLALQDEEGVETRSEGRDEGRHVVVRPVD